MGPRHVIQFGDFVISFPQLDCSGQGIYADHQELIMASRWYPLQVDFIARSLSNGCAQPPHMITIP